VLFSFSHNSQKSEAFEEKLDFFFSSYTSLKY
jgi:hypothetical protein